jgi:hypothetical protein
MVLFMYKNVNLAQKTHVQCILNIEHHVVKTCEKAR